MMRTRNARGQVTVETAVMYGLVVAGMVAMGLYLQRGVQGGFKSNADSFGSQFSATKSFTSKTVTKTVDDGTNLKQDQTSKYQQQM